MNFAAVAAMPIALSAALACASAHSQTPVFRCGNTYTNDAHEAQAKGCKPMDGGNFTVIEGTRVHPQPTRQATAPGTSKPAAAAQPSRRIDSSAQRARDADARRILEAELEKAEARHAELLKEYKNGEPDKLGPETRNYQKYLDRVAELKAAITRNEADIASIERELSRLTASR